MADLPPELALPQYAKPANPKIKIKMPSLKAIKEKSSPVTEKPTVTLKLPVPSTSNAEASSSKAGKALKEEPVVSRPRLVKPAPVPTPEPKAISPAPTLTPALASVATALVTATPTASTPAKAPTKPDTKASAKAAPQPNGSSATPQPATPVAPSKVSKQPPKQTPKQAPAVSTPIRAQPVAISAQPAIVQSFVNTFSHYPNAAYNATPPVLQQSISPPVATPTPKPPAPPAINHNRPYSRSQSPAPLSPAHMLQRITLKFQPRGRLFYLDHKLGVKCWAMRLGKDESIVDISDITFQGSDDAAESDLTEDEDDVDEDGDVDVEPPAKGGKRKGAKRGRGRPATKAKVKAKVNTRSAKVAEKQPVREEIQVKLDGILIQEKEDSAGNWTLTIPTGSHIMEAGEKGGLIWKVYFDRR
jgi:chromatin structure-remodeling complex subunit RSC4